MEESKKTAENQPEETTESEVDAPAGPPPPVLTRSEEEYQTLYNKYLTALADLKNTSARWQKEREDIYKYHFQSTLERFLPLLDAFELAFISKPPNVEAENYQRGFQFLHEMMKQILFDQAVVIYVPEIGTPFDHTEHFASEKVEVSDPDAANKVQAVILKGYKLNGRVIRPSHVRVSVLAPSQTNTEQEENNNG